MDNCFSWLTKGDQYMKGASGKDGMASKFLPGIQYNLLGLAFESYTMGILDSIGLLPDNHTLTDLIEALDRYVKIDPELVSTIKKYDEIQSICQISTYSRRDPDVSELKELGAAVMTIAQIAHEIIDKKSLEMKRS